MDWHVFLRPEVLALSIPILYVLFWGLKSVIRAMNGLPDDLDAWKREVEDLRARVEVLERNQQQTHEVALHR